MVSTICPVCREDWSGKGTFQNARGQVMCYPCHKSQTEKRIERSNAKSRKDIIMERYQEMREAIAERDRFRRDRDQIKTEIREEVRREVMTELTGLSFWRRLQILFLRKHG